MLNVSTRTVRSGASPNFDNVMGNDTGITTKRNVEPYSFPKDDKTGAHSIAALDRFICHTKNGGLYSDSIKEAVGEKPVSVNPYIPTKTHKPLPQESFRAGGRLANSCGCGLGKKKGVAAEPFCGCGKKFMENADSFMKYGPIIIVVLVLFAALLVARIIICRKNKTVKQEQPKENTMSGGAVDGSFDAII